MKKWIPLLVLLAVVITGIILYRNNSLQTQLLRDQRRQTMQMNSARTVADCRKLSEQMANKCFLKLALDEKDDSYCAQISRAIDKRKCEREVELAQ